MIIIFSGILGGLGLVALIYRKTFLGLILGLQIFLFGAGLMIVFAGIIANSPMQGFLLGLFISLSVAPQLVVIYALVVRFFSLKGQTHVDALSSFIEKEPE